jgi:hypothetical protein
MRDTVDFGQLIRSARSSDLTWVARIPCASSRLDGTEEDSRCAVRLYRRQRPAGFQDAIAL